MFYDCSKLLNAPELNATTLAGSCYMGMFQSCLSLFNAPSLPATTLAEGCYRSMFSFCTTLKNAPALTATTLAERCYEHMFYMCEKLKYVKCIATDITATNALTDWLSGVASSGTFVKASGTRWKSGASGIPEGWYVNEE